MSSITSPPPSLRQRRKDARPLELLEAALALFVEKGFAATRSEEVAQRAGVSKGTLYLYYPSKEELLKAVIAHYLSARIEATAHEVQRYRGPMAPLMRDTLVAWWQQVYDSPGSGCFKIVISEVRNFPDIANFYLQRVVEPGSALIAGIVQRGVASGEFRPVNVANVVHSIVLPMVMLCTHKHALGACTTHHAIDAPAFIAEHVDLMLHGLLQDPLQAAPRIAAEPLRRPPR